MFCGLRSINSDMTARDRTENYNLRLNKDIHETICYS